ncbi:hypothetical protein CRUP_029936 [Coryphaenoides rupestris]|nr:hypothetical protein CRUP_029936 [Coryphaenoides rupestris]
MRSELEKYGIPDARLQQIGGIPGPTSCRWTRLLGQAVVTMATLLNSNAMLKNVQETLAQDYQDTMSRAKAHKEHQCSGRRCSVSSEERDVYEELLTQQEIQGCTDLVNVQAAVGHVNRAVSSQDEASLLAALRLPALVLLAVQEANSRWYMEHFTNYCQHKAKEGGPALLLEREEIQRVVSSCNDFAEAEKRKLEAVAAINAAVRLGRGGADHEELLNPEAQLPIVYQTAANLYQAELFSLQLQGGRPAFGGGWPTARKLPHLELTSRSASTTVKRPGPTKEHERIIAIAEINEAMDSGDYQQTLAALLLPTAKLSGVDPATAKHYHDLLQDTKRRLCQVPKIAPPRSSG